MTFRHAEAFFRGLLCWLAVLPIVPPAWAASAHAVTLQGEVSAVTSGDTLWIQPSQGAPVAVRLRDVDAPEPCQPWGEQARAALSALALHQPAVARGGDTDRQQRQVATVRVEGIDLGPRMVEDGNAWSQRWRFDNGPLVKQERVARALGRGLHGAGITLRPAEYRRLHGACPAASAPG